MNKGTSMPQLSAIPAFSDNYIWALHDRQHCVVVDPGQAQPVMEFLATTGTRLRGILITHHHADHIGGVDQLVRMHASKYPDSPVLPVSGPADQRIPVITQALTEGDTVVLPEWDIKLHVLEIPGHTSSHIAFWNERWLFCGDTLFSAGCGRLFEGTAMQMQNSLDKLAALPGELLVCCAHEYTQSNCRFALQVEPNNQHLQRRSQYVDQLRQQNKMTLPVTLADELCYNPFLRSRESSVIQAAKQQSIKYAQANNKGILFEQEPHQVLAVIRSWKDAN